MTRPRILVVKNQPTCDLLKGKGYDVQGVENLQEALKQIEKNQFNLVVTDLSLIGTKGREGLEIAQKVKEKSPKTEVIVITADGTIPTAIEATRLGAFYITEEADSPERLLDAVRSCLNKRNDTCFVIQPFDAGKFDKRFEQVYKPAIEAAGLEAYRVDRDPRVDILFQAIEDGIRSAAVCLADITTDNPNVWYELGYAFASGRPVVMVCSSEERTGVRYPFDIQHRPVISFLAQAPDDFHELLTTITERIKALHKKGNT